MKSTSKLTQSQFFNCLHIYFVISNLFSAYLFIGNQFCKVKGYIGQNLEINFLDIRKKKGYITNITLGCGRCY